VNDKAQEEKFVRKRKSFSLKNVRKESRRCRRNRNYEKKVNNLKKKEVIFAVV
jgi:hypothetical protein